MSNPDKTRELTKDEITNIKKAVEMNVDNWQYLYRQYLGYKEVFSTITITNFNINGEWVLKQNGTAVSK